ncbi:MAG TPA: DUF4276 family protein [Pirellulales bacterium]|nr:DUF4276 family protein [Pirellulales bacterium]
MARLYLFAEGPTEQRFAGTVLGRHLANFGVYLQKPVLVADARKKGKVHRGGGRKYLPMKNDIVRFLAQEKAPDVFFITMIDLYGIHTGFPGLAEAEKLRHSPAKRVECLENAFAADIGAPRFIPHIQLHEFESLLFAEPAKFELFFPGSEKTVAALKAVADAHASPEEIDDGPTTAPSKRIIALIPAYEGSKATAAPQLAAAIGLETIRGKCPHFAAWLTLLESLAT